MDAASITADIVEAFGGVDVVVADGNRFYFYDPGRDRPVDRRFPFATLVTSDVYDRASDLDRPEVYRLNVGVGRDTYRALFGPPPATPAGGGLVDTGHDFTALDVVMPHPVYAPMSWICVLNPSAATFAQMQPLLAEAYQQAAGRYTKARPEPEA